MSELRDLYQELILDHGKNPRNFGAVEDADFRADGHNPLCGDRITVYVRAREGVVEEVHFDGVHLSGHFDWDTPEHGANGYGRERFTGTFDPDTMHFSVTGYQLENYQGIVAATYEATVSQDGRTLYDGSWRGAAVIPSHDWTAVRCEAIESTFDAGLEDWQAPDDGELAWRETGGDPDGYARVWDDGTGNEVNVVSPSTFHGDWLRAAEVPAMISVDYRLFASSGSRYRGPSLVISGPGGAATLELPTAAGPATQHWQTVLVPLEESIWTVTSGTWEGLLADVTHFEIGAEYTNGEEEVGVDNVRLLLPWAETLQWQVYTNPNTIEAFLFDGSDVWVSTKGGLLHSPDAGASWELSTVADNLPSSEIRHVLEFAGEYYLSCWGSAVVKGDGQTFAFLDGLASHDWVNHGVQFNGDLFFSKYFGVDQLSGGNVTFHPLDGVILQGVEYGQQLWFASSREGLHVFA